MRYFIAVSPHDETNIIAAITAKKLGANTIARARDPNTRANGICPGFAGHQLNDQS